MQIEDLINRLREIQDIHGDLWIENASGSLRESDDVRVRFEGDGPRTAVSVFIVEGDNGE